MKQPAKPVKPGRKPFKLEVPASLKATYVNFAMIMHTGAEFIIDFAQLVPNMPKTQVQSRIVMTPTHAKLLHKALSENIANYEKKFGPIKTPPTLADHLFSNIMRSGGGEDEDKESKETNGEDET